MAQHICFRNPGEIDPRLISTMGVNVKESDNPIGYFGTGLKYAIAGSLRLGCQIEIWSGDTQYRFEVELDKIRGKEFGFIVMCSGTTRQRLGFTTELGKNWQPWMVYRELYCNCKDEGGTVEFDQNYEIRPGETLVVVSGEAIVQAHLNRERFILQTEPLFENERCNIHAGDSDGIFYKGIRVLSFEKTRTVFTYNIQGHLDLTEDRTVNLFSTTMQIARATLELTNREAIRAICLAGQNNLESTLDYNWSSIKPTDEFIEELHAIARKHRSQMNPSLLAVLKRFKPELDRPIETQLSKVEAICLERAKIFCTEQVGLPITSEVYVTDSLGSETYGMVLNEEIWLARRAFMIGTKCVAGTLLEEQLHINSRHADFSRGLQNWLVDKIISLGEELAGAPL